MISILKKHSILYVEDEPAIQTSIAEYLSNYFGKIHLASNGQAALEMFAEFQPDVLLLDINLPDIDGLSVAEQVRRDNSTSKIIMLTAHTDKDMLLRATELKLTKYLTKPVAPKVFKQTLIFLAQELLENPILFVRLGSDLIWNLSNETLVNNNRIVSLTEKEHRLLKLFIERKGSVISYESITAAVWENAYDKNVSLDSIKNQVSKLRKHLPADCIVSVYGEGYMLK